MAPPERPRSKSPFAGDGSWNAPVQAPREPPRAPRGAALPLAVLVVGGGVVLVAGLVALLLVGGAPARRGPPASVIVEASASASARAVEPGPLPVGSTPQAASTMPTAPAPAETSLSGPAGVSALPRDVRAALGAARPRLRACFEQARKAYPTAGGHATMSLAVGVDGRVTAASVTGATPPSLDACMQKVGAMMLFAAGDAPRTITIPLALDSQ